MRIDRVWAMPNLWTFTIKPIKELITDELVGLSCDPFAGRNSPANVTNDLVEKADFNMDALDFLKSQPDGKFDTVLYDPPYSLTQARNYGSKKYANMMYWAACKTEVGRILKQGGVAICCGWNTNGLGKSRGFEMKRVLIVVHGGSKNDTLVTVEKKL